jgi:hypothetical protein
MRIIPKGNNVPGISRAESGKYFRVILFLGDGGLGIGNWALKNYNPLFQCGYFY